MSRSIGRDTCRRLPPTVLSAEGDIVAADLKGVCTSPRVRPDRRLDDEIREGGRPEAGVAHTGSNPAPADDSFADVARGLTCGAEPFVVGRLTPRFRN
jgi:hypothetical protein